MAELTAYEKKRQEEYEKFVKDRRKNKRKDVPTISPGAKKLARSEMRDRIIQKAMDAQKVAEEKMYANIPNYSYEQLMKLEDPAANRALKSYYRNNPDFDTDFPPKEGTVARRIWDKEDAKRREDRKKKLQQEAVREADERLGVPSQEQAAMGPLSNVRTRKFDPDADAGSPQGEVFNFIDYDKMVDREAKAERARLNDLRQTSPSLRPEGDAPREGTGMSSRSLEDAKRVSDFRRRFSKDTQQAYDVENIRREDGPAFMEMMKQDRDNIRKAEEAETEKLIRDYGLSQKEFVDTDREAVDKGIGAEGYDKAMSGREGFPETTVNYPGTKKAQIEQIDIDTKDIAEQLDEEGITDPEERKAVKEQVGNYFRDTSTNQLINLDRLQAEMDTIQKREDLFATAQLLSGKARQKFMINNNLIDEDDIPAPTKLEALEKELKLNETQFKLAELVKKTADLNKPEAKKLSEEQKAMVDVGKEYLKEGDVDNARAAFEAAGIKMPSFKVDNKKASEALIELAGGTMDLSKYGVATKEGLEKFFDNYQRDKRELLKGMSSFKYASVDGFTIEKKTKSIPYFKSAGVPLWEELQERAGTEGAVTNFDFIQDSSLRRRMELVSKQLGGFSNETEYISAVTDIVYDRQLDRLTNGFHSEYLDLTQAGKGDQPLLTPGFKKGSDTGEEGAGSVEGTDFEEETTRDDLAINPEQAFLPKTLARKDENVESTDAGSGYGDLTEAQREQRVGSFNESIVQGVKDFLPKINPFRSVSSFGDYSNKDAPVVDSEPEGEGGGGGQLQAAELAQPISDMILNDPLNEQFTFGDFTDGRRGVENLQAFDRTQRFEGKFTPKIRQEFFEKKKGERRKPVMANGKPVYHIGYGIRLPLNKKEVQVLRSNGFKGNPNEFLKAPTRAHAKKLQGDKYSITENQAEALMKHRYANHIRDLIKSNQEFAKDKDGKIDQTKVINWSGLPRQVREVLFDMSYNIGPRFLTRKQDPFKNLRQSILDYQASPTRENVEKMVVDIRESKYYREQVGNRASANMQTLLDLIN